MTTARWRALKTAGSSCYNQQIGSPLFSELGANALVLDMDLSWEKSNTLDTISPFLKFSAQ